MELTRRQVVAGAAGAAAAAYAGHAAAQSTPNASPATSPMTEIDRVVSSVEGVPDAYLALPANPPKTYEGTPANGGTIRFTHLIYSSPATPREKNEYWKELERRIGVEKLEINEIPFSTYAEKVAALLASGDLGDLFFLNPSAGGAASIYQALTEGAFFDLTDDLTGENLQRFPNLAKLPAAMWEQMRVNGRIYGVPNPMPQGTDVTFYRKDWADKIGVAEGKTEDEIFAFFDAFHTKDPDGNGQDDTYAFGNLYMNWLEPTFCVPNVWRLNDDGTLTRDLETEEWRRAVEFQRKMYEAGMLHPDAPGMNFEAMGAAFMSGQTAAMSQGLATWWGQNGTRERMKEVQPGSQLVPYLPVAADGGDPGMYPNPAFYGFVGIPTEVASDEERRLELLRVMDYFYPPFGSEEYMFQIYGLPGIHYNMENGLPVSTDQASADISNLMYGAGTGELYLFHAGFPEDTKELQKIIEFAFTHRLDNPTLGLYSAVSAEKSPALNQYVSDARTEVVFGRKPLEELDKVVEEWRSRGGDEIRADYERLIKERDAAQ